MIHPLELGNSTFPVNLIQGPLAGVSSAPFRRLTSQFSKPAFTCTEMISCKTILHQSETALKRYITIDPDEGPVCFQLSSHDPYELSEATKYVTAIGANLIDLNCGCPVKKIRRKGAGSRLLSESTQLYHLIKAMKQSTHLPVSIKIRVDGNSHEKYNAEIAKMVADAGADFLVVHGRHWTERYTTACHYTDIQFFVDRLTIPVIGNGDIACLTSLRKMFQTGCAGVMISRAGVGQPWLIGKLIAEMKQEKFAELSSFEIGNLFLEHTSQLIQLLGNEKKALYEARQFAKYYGRHLTNKMEFCRALNICEKWEDFLKICHQYF